MTPANFERALRSFTRRVPFQRNGGYAGFIAEDGLVHFFNSNNVRRMGEEMNGATA